jgi:primosomal protein N' (replication factor Y)
VKQRDGVGEARDHALHEVVRQGDLRYEQQHAVAAIDAARGRYAPFLLQGVTGSGKTEVYLDAAARAIDAGGQVLMLVPEIGLTPALQARVRAALPGVRIAVLHSGLAEGTRRRHWEAAASGQARLVLGTRLAVFTPMPDLALVVVDEEHDGSYKQQDGVRYHARDVAVWRAHARGVPVVLGSATPSLESFANARDGRYRRLDLHERADPRARLPTIVLAPDRDARHGDGIGPVLADALARGLARGEQCLVFINRRGYAPSLKCAACGWDAQCTRCSARLVLHRHPPGLACHHCGHHERVPPACPSCGNVDLLPQGFGTQRLERHLRTLFPAARIARIDRDTTRAIGSFDAVRQRMHDRELDLLIGTQMLAKGHDFPRLTTVGVLGADNALYSADFRATERLCALLMQVAGRAGRAERPGEVVVQTDFPDHPVYAALRAHDYESFAGRLLDERAAAGLPPATHVALLAAEAHDRADVDRFLDEAHAAAAGRARGDAVAVFPPVPALMARRAGFERAQMLVQAPRRADLQRFLPDWHAALRALPGRKVRWAIDVDPAGF